MSELTHKCSVLLRLEGPMQAWSAQGKLGVRDTEREPTKSGVLGLVGCALGMERSDLALLATLRTLKMVVRVDRDGTILRDYHTAGGGKFRGQRDYFVLNTSNPIPTERYYLQDASFLVALEGEQVLVERIATALQSPHWPLFLGRRSCAPSEPIFAGTFALPAIEVLKVVPKSRSGQQLRSHWDERKDPEAPEQPEKLRVIHECEASEGDPRYDVPLSFLEGSRRYGTRYVRTEWLSIASTRTANTNTVATATSTHENQL